MTIKLVSNSELNRWKAETDAKLDAARIIPLRDIEPLFEEMIGTSPLVWDDELMETGLAKRPWWKFW